MLMLNSSLYIKYKNKNNYWNFKFHHKIRWFLGVLLQLSILWVKQEGSLSVGSWKEGFAKAVALLLSTYH